MSSNDGFWRSVITRIECYAPTAAWRACWLTNKALAFVFVFSAGVYVGRQSFTPDPHKEVVTEVLLAPNVLATFPDQRFEITPAVTTKLLELLAKYPGGALCLALPIDMSEHTFEVQLAMDRAAKIVEWLVSQRIDITKLSVRISHPTARS